MTPLFERQGRGRCRIIVVGPSRVVGFGARGASARPLGAEAGLGRVGRRRPAGQQVERLLGGGPGLGGVERQAQAVVGVERQRLVAELQLTDDRVQQALGARAVKAHVVRRPAHAELLAARRQLADQVLEAAVIRVAPGLRAQRRHQLGRQSLPVGVELARRRVQEREPPAVGRLLAAVEHRRVERAAQRVGGQVVAVDGADDRRRLDLLEQPQQHRAHTRLQRPRALRRDRARGARQVEQVRALGVVELQRSRQRFQHELGDPADLAALQAPVVVRAHPGQRRDLLAPQARHPPLAVARQADLLGRDLRPPAGEELGDVVGGVHG